MMIAEIQKELAESADAQTAVFLQKFFKTEAGGYGAGDLFHGIRVPVLRKLARKHQNVPLLEAEELLHSEFHEDRLLALLIFVRRKRSGRSKSVERTGQIQVEKKERVVNEIPIFRRL